MPFVVGLGNPGRRYRQSRHNLGFRVVEELARRWGVRLDRMECNALIASTDEAHLIEPQTYMNRSGYAVRCLVERHGVGVEEILIVFDDADLELGRLRLRRSGGPGGHRGMESVIQNLRTEAICRLRLGIAPESSVDADDLVDWVLSPFEMDEQEAVEEMVARAADACESWLREGTEATMNRFNG